MEAWFLPRTRLTQDRIKSTSRVVRMLRTEYQAVARLDTLRRTASLVRCGTAEALTGNCSRTLMSDETWWSFGLTSRSE